MAIGLRAGDRVGLLGTADLLNAFLSTVCVRLEGGDWGSQFPLLMRELADGDGIAADQVEAFDEELCEIEDGLLDLDVDQLVWDMEDPAARPPWGDDIADIITSLGTYFRTCDDSTEFITRMGEVAAYAEEHGTSIELHVHA